MGAGATEALGFATMLGEWVEACVPTLHSDSRSALHACKEQGLGRMKDLEIRSLALQECRDQHRLQFVKVPSETDLADMLRNR